MGSYVVNIMIKLANVLAVVAVAALQTLSHALSQQRPEVNGILGPPTSNTCFWTDRAFKNIQERGPANAAGIILWSHGQAANRQRSWQFGAPPIIRLFADRGWDVVLAQRNERCSGNWNERGREYVANLVEEVAKAKNAGYRRIIVAGQSFGAATALGATAMTKDIDGVISFALSHGRGSCRNPKTFRSEMIPFHEQMIKTSIAESHIPRILISVGKDDHCVGVTFTPLVAESLASKNIPYIHFDESMRQTGHGAAVSSEFATTYGECVLDFFVRTVPLPPGRHVCAPGKG